MGEPALRGATMGGLTPIPRPPVDASRYREPVNTLLGKRKGFEPPPFGGYVLFWSTKVVSFLDTKVLTGAG